MTVADLERVMEIAEGLKDAPHWPAGAYLRALEPEAVPRRIAVVAEEHAGGVMGFAIASVVMPEAELETIAVVGEGQRRGVGRRLSAAMAEELRAVGVTKVTLEVRASNGAAVGFYRAQGFAEMGRRTRYYADPVGDAVLMGLRL
jgi:ribosomal-protein-alanine N-acetyltransferase